MKQKLLTAILLLLALATPFAASADSFKVTPVNLEPGTTGTLQFVLDNPDGVYYGFQAEVKLPTGLEAVKKGTDGSLDFTLSNRASGGAYEVNSNTLSNGNLIMGAFSGNKTAFTGKEGALLDLKVKVADTFTGGDVIVSNIYFIDADNKDVKFDATSTTLGVEVTEVTFTRTTLTLNVGENTTFVATVHPDEAADKNVTWASSDPSVASVTDNGYVVAIKAGTTTITATSTNGKVASCTLTVKAVAVTSISLNKTELNLTEGDKETLTATLLPENATNKTVTWSSDDESVATVSDTGEVTAVGSGNTTITATANGKVDSCTVTVAKKIIVATAIELSATTAELKVGGTATLTATVVPDNTTDKTVTWKSSDEAVATVDANGKVTAKALGDATITATCGSATATCKVSVVPTPVESVSFTRKQLIMKEGDTTTLTPNFNPTTATYKSVTWESSDESVATVSATGEVTAVKEGEATITVTTTNGKSASIPVAVSANIISVTSISISKTELNLTEGDKETLTATVTPDDATDQSVEWSSDNAEVAIVSENGEVTAVAEGTAIITAESSNGKTAKCTVTVAKKIIVATAIELSATTAELKVGGTATLTATVVPDNTTDKTVTWTSSNEAVATVDNGKVTAKALGEATITATCGSATATCKVTVSPTEVESIKLNSTELNLTEGDNASLKVTFTPSGATDKTVTWSTSDATVATVENGVVTAVKAGTATITATSSNGKTATCAVTVEAKEIPVTSITISDASLELMIGKTATLNVTIDPADATDQSVEWTSSNPKVASVSAEGVVTAKAVGTATITVSTHNGKSATCTVKVLPIPVESLAILNEDDQPLDSTHSLAMHTGDEYTLTEVVSPANATDQKVTWTSSDETVAKIVDIVEEPHQVHIDAIGEGEATITASLAGFSTSFKVTVTNPVIEITGIKLDKTTAEMKTGETLQLNATIEPEDATSKEVKWSSSNTAVATVNAKGVVTAVKAGKVTITATANKKTANCVITISDPVVAVSGITLDRTEANITEGESLTLVATVDPENATDKSVTWTSSNEAVATVKDGVVTAVAAGEATITAKAGEMTATCTVTVAAKVIPVEGITLSKTTATITEGKSLTLTVNYDPNNASDKTVTWTSSDEAVATVEDGVVTAVAPGVANITATTSNGKSATCVVTVEEDRTQSSDADVNMTYVNMNEPDTAYGEIAAGETAMAGYNKISGGSVGFSNAGWGVNYITYLQVKVPEVQGSITGASLTFEGSGSTDSKRTTSWGVGYNSSEWSADMTYNTADMSITTMGEVKNGSTKSAKTFENYSFDITDAIKNADENGYVTILVYETAAGGGYIKNPTATINWTSEPTYKVTFTETTGVENVKVTIDGKDVTNGTELINGTYNFTATAPAYKNYEGEFTVAGEDLDVKFEMTPKALWSYTVNAVDANGEFLAELSKGEEYENEDVTFYFPGYYLQGNTLLSKAHNSTNPYYGQTVKLDSDGKVFEVVYDGTPVSDAVFYKEAEDIEGFTSKNTNNAPIRCSNGLGGITEEEVLLVTLPAGTYKIHGQVWGTKGLTAGVKVKAASEEEDTILWSLESTGSLVNSDSEEFKLATKTDLYVYTTNGDNNHMLDLIYITGTESEEPGIIEVEEITLDTTEASMKVGDDLQLTATVTPANATEATVMWTTSDEFVATVDADGKVTAVGEGTVTITAQAGEKTAECVITVSKETSAVELIGLDPEAPVKVYDMNGIFVGESMEGLQQGTYIVRQGNVAKKVNVR